MKNGRNIFLFFLFLNYYQDKTLNYNVVSYGSLL